MIEKIPASRERFKLRTVYQQEEGRQNMEMTDLLFLKVYPFILKISNSSGGDIREANHTAYVPVRKKKMPSNNVFKCKLCLNQLLLNYKVRCTNYT